MLMKYTANIIEQTRSCITVCFLLKQRSATNLFYKGPNNKYIGPRGKIEAIMEVLMTKELPKLYL